MSQMKPSARASSLPERLRYLQPFRKKFASRAPEYLNEDTGEAPLFALLSKRIKGRLEAEAQSILETDLKALEEWLGEPANKDDCLQFVRGFLMVSPSELAKRIIEESAKASEPPPEAEMDLPKDAKVRRVKSRTEVAMIIRWKGTLTAIDSVTEEAAANFAEVENRSDGVSKLAILPIRFGEVEGTKFVRTGDSWHGPFKDVRYLLTAPGGHVYISTAVVSKKLDESKWDETQLEAYFHTLRVVRKC
jgi:hypothetical protein